MRRVDMCAEFTVAEAQTGPARGGARTMLVVCAALCVAGATLAHQVPPHPLLVTNKLQLIRHRRHLTPHSELTNYSHSIQIYGWHLILHENNAIRVLYDDKCQFYQGQVFQDKDSSAAITDCGGQFYGLLQVLGKVFVLQPTIVARESHAHVLRRRDVTMTEEPAFNLTGDTFSDLELDLDEDDTNGLKQSPIIGADNIENDIQYSHNSKIPVFTRPISGTKGLWLEIAIVADHTVLKFHGRERINHYILALMNIVSAIFNDPSLNSNLTLVINKVFLYEDKDLVIKVGNVKKSLESVNKWNYKHLARLPADVNGWDAAIWLTRAELGGPSGFAPVSGVCSHTRSAAIIRDEGLTSAFVIAHELGHLLGLSHDGDGECDEDSRRGSVMATTVLATLQQYSWSSCSKKQFHEKSRSWWCMHERSSDAGVTMGGAPELVKYVFTMDEQCRTEFGEGFSVCKLQTLKWLSQCARLWCAHLSMPQVCRSKRGPPLEGTPCGDNHWCVDRVCEPMPGRVEGQDSISVTEVTRNVTPFWGEWGSWGDCDADCGYGLRIKTRPCKDKELTSKECEGASTEAQSCWAGRPCAGQRDLRAAICRRHSINFIPYLKVDDSQSCEIWCVDYKGGEGTMLGTLPDRTACSYRRPYDLCFQGSCIKGQCDASDPVCSWCKGGFCNNNTFMTYPKLRRDPGWSRLTVIPHNARYLSILITSPVLLKFAIKEKGKSKPTIELGKHNLKRYNIQDVGDKSIRYDLNVPQNLQIIEIDADVIRRKEEEHIGYEGHVVVAGTVLEWRQTPQEITITANSPLQSDLMILGSQRFYNEDDFKEFISIEVVTNYSTPASRAPLTNYRLYTERGPCSVSCGGGVRLVRTRCIPGRRCLPQRTIRVEPCNLDRCEFTWAAAEWEACSETCGGGFQQRQLFCVPVGVRTASRRDLITSSVSPALCTSSRPPIYQACNQMQCPVYWQELSWTPCSTTCGRGVSRKPLMCPGDNDHMCGPKPQERHKRCRLQPCVAQPCTGSDTSQYCEYFPPDQLARNCVLPLFRKYCCNSCRDNDISRMGQG